MGKKAKYTWKAAALSSLCAILACLLLIPADVFGRHRGSIRSGRLSRDRYYYTPGYERYEERRLQQDRIEAEEEARREPAREKRREEIGQQKEADVEAYLESQEAIRSSSQAATRAPRGFFYRKPGTSTTQLPAGAVAVEVDGRSYQYFSGIYYRSTANTHVVVTAPAGALIDSLPDGHGMSDYRGKTYFYYFGSFYLEEEGKYRVVIPPPGVVVGYLPDGYNEMRDPRHESVTYEYGGVQFEPVFLEGLLVYMVVGT